MLVHSEGENKYSVTVVSFMISNKYILDPVYFSSPLKTLGLDFSDIEFHVLVITILMAS